MEFSLYRHTFLNLKGIVSHFLEKDPNCEGQNVISIGISSPGPILPEEGEIVKWAIFEKLYWKKKLKN